MVNRYANIMSTKRSEQMGVIERSTETPTHQEHELRRLFCALSQDGRERIERDQLYLAFRSMGILEGDPRLKSFFKEILANDPSIDFEAFQRICGSNPCLVEQVIRKEMIIPDFPRFSAEISEIFHKTRTENRGSVASYIPQLKRVNPDLYGVSLCTIDGQRLSLGEADEPYVVQSCCKPIGYCLALEEQGEQVVHRHVGREPSGHGFNELTLNGQGLPHNPMINAGAIMCCSLIKKGWPISDRFDYVLGMWERLSGNARPVFNNSVYLSERQTADRNFALGYFMRENGAFPAETDLTETLEFYFQCCSIEMTCESMSVVAATLANAGICPITGQRVLTPDTVKNCLSLMYSCGMYDFSGEFAFTVGLPAKSGVSGALLLVVPGLMGMAIWSPRLDDLGNSVRALAFCKELVAHFNFHNYDGLVRYTDKKDPRLRKNAPKLDGVVALCWAANQGDLDEIKRLVATGINLNETDYDGRCALHLAASEGHLNIVEYLLAHGVSKDNKDRWGNKPIDDARREGHRQVETILS